MQSVNCLGCQSSIPSAHMLKLCYVLIRQQMRAGIFVVLSSQNSILSFNFFLCEVFLLLGEGISLQLISFANTLGSQNLKILYPTCEVGYCIFRFETC